MKDIIKEVLSKLKLIEFVMIVLITTSLFVFLPEDFLTKLSLLTFKNKYISYISFSFILSIAFFILEVIKLIQKKLRIKMHGIAKIATDYMKKWISKDEIEFLIETFYDDEENKFRSSGKADYTDGRRAALESQNIIYRASNISSGYTTFAYNLQPVILKYLNTNISKGKIVINKNQYKWIK